MSEVYLVSRTKQVVDDDTTLSIYDSTMSIDFDFDDFGEFGVLSFRVPAEVLMKLVSHSRRSLQVDTAEVRSLLKAIIENEIEPEDLRKKSEQILFGGK
jgi:hypothetical protein